DFQLGHGGMIGGHRLTRTMNDHLGDLTIEALPLPFVALATDLITGHEVWLRQGPLVDALRASFSLPGLFAPVRAGDRWLVDRAMVNPLPVSVCGAMGAQVVIAVSLHADLIGRNRWPGSGVPRAAGFDLLNELPADAQAHGGALEGALRHIFGRAPDRPSLFG